MDRPAGWAERSDAMARSGRSSQVGVRYRRPPTSVRNLPARTAPAEPGVGASSSPSAQRKSCPSKRGGLSGPGMRVYLSGVPFRRIVRTYSIRSRRAYRTVRPIWPQPASLRPAAARIEHRHLGLVHEELVDSFQVPRQPVGDRHQMERSRADPASPFQVLLS